MLNVLDKSSSDVLESMGMLSEKDLNDMQSFVFSLLKLYEVPERLWEDCFQDLMVRCMSKENFPQYKFSIFLRRELKRIISSKKFQFESYSIEFCGSADDMEALVYREDRYFFFVF